MKAELIKKEKIVESLAMQLDLIEPGLRFIDSAIDMMTIATLDILALDASNRIVLINVADRNQSLRGRKGEHIINSSAIAWHWIIDHKDGFFNGIKSVAKVEPMAIPPRLIIIAPDYSKSLVSLTEYVANQIEVELFKLKTDELNQNNNTIVFSKNSFSKVDLSGSKKDSKSIKNFNKHIDSRLRYMRGIFVKMRDHEKSEIYKPLVV